MKKKKTMKSILSMLMVLLMPGALSMTTHAECGFDRDAAVGHAEENWYSTTPYDCANYVTECIHAGGITDIGSAGSTTLHNQLANSGYGTEYTLDFDGYVYAGDCYDIIEPGDVIQFHCSNCINVDGCPWIHTVLVAGVEPDGRIRAYSHSSSNDGQDAYVYDTSCWDCGGWVDSAWLYHWDTDGSRSGSYGNNPKGWVDSITGAIGGVDITAWAFDYDDVNKPLNFKVYFNGDQKSGAPFKTVSTNDDRPDIEDYYPNVGDRHGFQGFVEGFESGEQTIYVYAENIGGGQDTLIGSKTVNITKRFDLAVDKSNICMNVGEKQNFTISYSTGYSSLTAYPTISDLSVVLPNCEEVKPDHLTISVEGLKAGKCTLEYDFKDGDNHLLGTAIIVVTVTDKPNTVSSPEYTREYDQVLTAHSAENSTDGGWKRWARAAYDNGRNAVSYVGSHASDWGKDAYETGASVGRRVYSWLH